MACPCACPSALLAIGVAALSTRYIEGRFRIRGPSRGSLRTLVVAVACSAAVAMTSLAASGDLTSASGSEAPLPTLGPVTAARPPLPEPVLAGPLPSDLEPTLLQAHRDNGGVMKGGCATRREETAAPRLQLRRRLLGHHGGSVRGFPRRHVDAGDHQHRRSGILARRSPHQARLHAGRGARLAG